MTKHLTKIEQPASQVYIANYKKVQCVSLYSHLSEA